MHSSNKSSVATECVGTPVQFGYAGAHETHNQPDKLFFKQPSHFSDLTQFSDTFQLQQTRCLCHLNKALHWWEHRYSSVLVLVLGLSLKQSWRFCKAKAEGDCFVLFFVAAASTLTAVEF